MNVNLFRKDRTSHVEVTLRFERLTFLDLIVEFKPINLYPGDSLQLTWNILLGAYVDNVKTDEMPFKSEATFHCTKSQVMRFSRFTFADGKGVVGAYEEMPDLGRIE